MTKQSVEVAHPELVGGDSTTLHTHPGGGGGGLVDKSGIVTSNGSGEATVSFNTSYGSTGYFIQLTAGESIDATMCNVKTGTKTVSGFTLVTMDDGGKAEPSISVYWCTGLYSNP